MFSRYFKNLESPESSRYRSEENLSKWTVPCFRSVALVSNWNFQKTGTKNKYENVTHDPAKADISGTGIFVKFRQTGIKNKHKNVTYDTVKADISGTGVFVKFQQTGTKIYKFTRSYCS